MSRKKKQDLCVLKSLPGNVDSGSGCQHAAPGKGKTQTCYLFSPVFSAPDGSQQVMSQQPSTAAAEQGPL